MDKTGERKARTQRNHTASNVSDLHTISEDRVSSQATAYSHRTQLTSGTAGTSSQDFDDFEDIISNPIDTLQITPEEEKKIQNILEFARKGVPHP